MARVVYSANALDNIERVLEFLAKESPRTVPDASRAIQSAITMLETHPLIGRRIHDELRELVISYGRTGYVALYRYIAHRDEVRVLALKHQRELDYPD